MRDSEVTMALEGFLAGLFAGVLLAVVVGSQASQLNAVVIEHGYALYHPVTGEFVWRDEYEKSQEAETRE